MRANSNLRPFMMRLPEELRARVVAEAARDGMSVNAKINELLWDSLLCSCCLHEKDKMRLDIGELTCPASVHRNAD